MAFSANGIVPRFAKVDLAGEAQTLIVSASAGTAPPTITVLGFVAHGSSVDFKFVSSGSGGFTDLTGLMTTPVELGTTYGVCQAPAGEALYLSHSADIDGVITYR